MPAGKKKQGVVRGCKTYRLCLELGHIKRSLGPHFRHGSLRLRLNLSGLSVAFGDQRFENDTRLSLCCRQLL